MVTTLPAPSQSVTGGPAPVTDWLGAAQLPKMQ